MKFWRNLSMKWKMVVLGTLGVMIMGVFAVGTSQMTAHQVQQQASVGIVDVAKGTIQSSLEDKVGIAYALVQYHYTHPNGRSDEQVRRDAMDAVKALRFGPADVDYFWIHTYDVAQPEKPVMVMHPNLTQLDGKELLNFVDKEKFAMISVAGAVYSNTASEIRSIQPVNLFIDMNRVVRDNAGKGFVHYYWSKPGKSADTAYSKVSFVRLFEPWGWVIGSGAYDDEVEMLASETVGQIGNSLLRSTQFLGVVILVVFLASIGIAIFISGGIAKPIWLCVDAFSSMADHNHALAQAVQTMAKGDFSHELHRVQGAKKTDEGQKMLSERGDELGALFRSLGQLQQQHQEMQEGFTTLHTDLSQTLLRIVEASNQVGAGSGEISEASQTLSQGATETAASLEEISASATEIGQQAKHNAETATQANQLAMVAKTAAETGSQRMKGLNTSMSAITESSAQIAKIIKTIDDIAFQTNILALNAAVEAARAGRHGKGFAVVAEEVRSLAARSAKAARETADLIEGSTGRVDDGNRMAKETAAALAEIVGGIVKVGDLVGEMAAASNEQAHGIAQISQGLGQIDKVTQQNTATAEETAAASEELSGQADELRALIGQFKLKGSINESVHPLPKAAVAQLASHE